MRLRAAHRFRAGGMDRAAFVYGFEGRVHAGVHFVMGMILNCDNGKIKPELASNEC
jgi:hypothetical protein